MKILKFNSDYKFYDSFDVVEELPNKVLSLEEGSFKSLYLVEKEDFSLPSKIYSNDSDFIDHVISSFSNLNKSVGVLLQGKKGLGKTFTAKVLCKKLNLPVIIITKQTNKGMFDFLNNIKQPHIIYIDEFEKIFPEEKDDHNEVAQEDFLTFLDGSNTNASKKLFIITSNLKVNEYLINRPSRIRYVRNYENISKEVINEIISDKLLNKDFTDDLINNLSVDNLNIDSLLEIIEEINISNKPYSLFKEYFNYSVEVYLYEYYLVKDNSELELINTKTFTETTYKHYGLKGYIDNEETIFSQSLISSTLLGDLISAEKSSYNEKGKTCKEVVKILIKKNFHKIDLVY